MATLRRAGHPSQRKLQRWMQGDDESLDRHLTTCDTCADRLEQMLGKSDDSVRGALLRVLLVPDELSERLEAGINENEEGRQDLLLVSELFALPVWTARVYGSTDQGDD